MERGFLNAAAQPCRTSVVHGPPSASSRATSTAKQASGDMTVTSKSDDYEEPLILPKHDYTVVEDDDPLILLADHRVEGAPYFGYFPPNKAVPEMVIIDRDSKRLEEAASWEVWKSSTSALERNESPSFVIQAVKGKGMAMIAARDIKMGELIHKEKPILVSIQTYNLAPDQGLKTGDFYRSALSRLGRRQQEEILSLSNCWDTIRDVIPGILATNYLPVDMQADPDASGRVYCGCFATLSRANHCCRPNANYCFQFKDFTGRFYAVCDIKAGEDITITYCDPLHSQEFRKHNLLHSYRFLCDCVVCGNSNTAGQIQASDSNRLLIKRTVDKLASSSQDRIKLLNLQNAIKAADQEGLVNYKAQLLYLGGAFVIQHNLAKLAFGLSWLREAKRLYTALEGEDSLQVAELQAQLCGMH